MLRNRRKLQKRLGLGLSGTLLAGLLSTGWAEELPDLTLPPTLDEIEVTGGVSEAPPVPDGYLPAPKRDGLAPVVPVPLSDETYPPVADDAGEEPPALDEVEGGDPFQAEIGAPREGSENQTKARPSRVAVQAVPTEDEVDAVEVIQQRYENGAIMVERGMKQDADGNYVLHGDWRHFDPKGTLVAEGRFVNNEREGQWRRYFRGNDALLFTSTPYREFQAPFVSQANFENGKLVGKWTISDSKQRVVSEINFVDGLRDGAARWYHPTGKLAHEVLYSQGVIDGDAQLWDANGQLVKTESYDAGRKSGLLSSAYKSGAKHVEAECLFAKIVVKTTDDWWTATLATYETVGRDERHGKFTVWHSNGAKQREGGYVHGQPVNKMTWWYANGQRQLQGNYENGVAVDAWSWWHSNGQKSISGSYSEGKPVGEWMWWHEDGKLAQKIDLEKLNDTERSAMLKKIPAPVSPLR